MKYLKTVLTLIFVIAGAVVYFSNKEWMSAPLMVNFNRVPFYEIPPVYTDNRTAVAAVFLLGMMLALIHSSLNWIELAGKNRKIRKLESEITESKENEKEKD